MIRSILAASVAIAGCYSNHDVIGTYVAHVYRDGDTFTAEICDIRPSRYSVPDPTSCRLEPIGPRIASVPALSLGDGIAAISRRARTCAAELHVSGIARLEIEIDRDRRVPHVASDRGPAFGACIARGLDQLRFDAATTAQTITAPFALATAS
ncbi:MAG TPA: hypothetical protein VGG28_09150 [Kofleriaceae bacterium]